MNLKEARPIRNCTLQASSQLRAPFTGVALGLLPGVGARSVQELPMAEEPEATAGWPLRAPG